VVISSHTPACAAIALKSMPQAPRVWLEQDRIAHHHRARVDTRYGQKLENSVLCKEGDFIYINADVPHQPINLSTTESVVALVARNDANEQENVITHRVKIANETSR